jgi:hypothetical protein
VDYRAAEETKSDSTDHDPKRKLNGMEECTNRILTVVQSMDPLSSMVAPMHSEMQQGTDYHLLPNERMLHKCTRRLIGPYPGKNNGLQGSTRSAKNRARQG